MMEEPSFVQSCPHCGKCFFYQDAKPESLSQEQGLITSFIDKVRGAGTGEMKPMKRPGRKKWRAICEEAARRGETAVFPIMRGKEALCKKSVSA